VRFRLRYLVVPLALAGLAAAVLWALPTDGYIFAPDRAKPLADHVRVPGAHPKGGGDVYYVDAFVRHASLLERILPFTRPDGSSLVPADRYLPTGVSDRERQRQVVQEMERSTEIAPAVALRALGHNVRAPRQGSSRRATSSSPLTESPYVPPESSGPRSVATGRESGFDSRSGAARRRST
jgi:PDZ domain-containing secreted protein